MADVAFPDISTQPIRVTVENWREVWHTVLAAREVRRGKKGAIESDLEDLKEIMHAAGMAGITRQHLLAIAGPLTTPPPPKSLFESLTLIATVFPRAVASGISTGIDKAGEPLNKANNTLRLGLVTIIIGVIGVGAIVYAPELKIAFKRVTA